MKKYTFTDLMDKQCFEFSRIEIPIIQRDYVQGQKDSEENKINKVGERFIKAIFDAMQTNTPMNMDFIYGSIVDGKFIPLDGQQRLTTLFLLHWYFACKTFNKKELDKKLEMLSHFSYETRITSREFCNELCKLKKRFTANETPSAYIRNEPWFFSRFYLDPTISSMLNMLDEIHIMDTKANLEYEKLNLLRFNILNLEEFGLTEELYLKMNARGKELTEFEKIKAEIENKVEKLKWEENIDEQEKFYYKADRNWGDIFWQYFKTGGDAAFLNFMAEILIINLTLKIRTLKNDDENAKIIERIQRIAGNPKELASDDFDKDSFLQLKDLLDLYCRNDNAAKKVGINLWDFCKNDNSLFVTICKIKGGAEVTYPVRGLFFAQNLYLQKAEFDDKSFQDWMRVMRNIAKNATIDSVQTFDGFLRLIEELSAGCSDIYTYLAAHEVKSNFAKLQMQEETYKAKNIIRNKKAKRLFTELEENNFCKGRLYFAFYCCGFDLKNDNTPLPDLHIFVKVKKVFDAFLSQNILPDYFRVLLFTCGDNKFYEYWGSWSYKTDTVKRRCIESITELNLKFSRYENNEYNKNILKEAVIKLTNEPDIKKILKEYKCPVSMPQWQEWIIKNPEEFIKHCSKYYFGITEDNKTCYLYNDYIRPNDREDCLKIPTGKV